MNFVINLKYFYFKWGV